MASMGGYEEGVWGMWGYGEGVGTHPRRSRHGQCIWPYTGHKALGIATRTDLEPNSHREECYLANSHHLSRHMAHVLTYFLDKHPFNKRKQINSSFIMLMNYIIFIVGEIKKIHFYYTIKNGAVTYV